MPENKLNEYFKALTREPRFEAARNLIKEIAYSFVDVDGNYIQQFQSDGFDARLWELFLYVYFYNAGFQINRKYSAPDYNLSKKGFECYVEALTVGPSMEFDINNPITTNDVIELSKDYLPIKFGSALFSKINRSKQYWDMDHVKGKPFILAVHDYHKAPDKNYPGSMTWSRAGLDNYLYGVRDEVEFDADGHPRSVIEKVDGKPRVKLTKTEFHNFGGKTIPSNFFKQPNSEYISAVLFSNGATITTFNRMGKLAGLGSKNINMIRMDMRAHVSANNYSVGHFSINVDSPNYEEAWGDTLIMYHNPNALYPINPSFFEDISHTSYTYETGDFFSIRNSNEVFTSTTLVLDIKDKA